MDWSGRAELIGSTRSFDLNSFGSHSLRHLKSLVYNTPVNNVEELRYRIRESCRRIQTTPGIFERARRSTIRRFEACVLAESGHFEQFLRKLLTLSGR
ncbi:hypothetical protein WH47_06090 [Habropoda laboriosa]|uniref:Uncharacterized protein n=1 Tax=Habropoda laboriosa TaxID=597456 RepID=A0A0L7QRY3_9HYME|nr:hypothetical protein WH47_06090 [Habropoda laboriosa]